MTIIIPVLATLRIPMFNKLNKLLNGNLLILMKAKETTDRESAEFDKCEFKWDLYTKQILQERIKEDKIVVVSNTKDAFSLLSLKFQNIKLAFWIGENEQTYKFRTNTLVKKAFKYFVYKQIDFFACYSQETIDFLNNKYNIDKSKTIQIPQSIEYEVFNKDKIYSTDGKIRFVVISRLIKNKLLPLLIKEFIFLQKEYPNITLDIYGKGEDKSIIENMIKEVGCIKLNDFVSYDNIPKVYLKYDYFIMQTVEDTWGLTVNEAIASRVGILTSKYAPAKEMIEDRKSGFIYDPYNSLEYKNAIKWAIDNFSNIKNITNTNYQNALEYYHYDNAAKAYYKINKNLLGEK